MSYISIEQPPQDMDPQFADYITRMFVKINNAIGGSGIITPTTILPAKPIEGKIYYFTVAIPTHAVITGEGLYVYKTTGWVLIA